MSTNLEWSPIPKNGKSLATGLKWAMRKRTLDGFVDGTFGEGDLDYFYGLLDAEVEDAQKVIDAITKHGKIRIKEV